MTARATTGRPLRFFGALLLLWIGARIALSMDMTPPATADRIATAAIMSPVARASRREPAAYRAAARATIWRHGIASSSALPPEKGRRHAHSLASASATDDAMPVDLLNFIRFTVAFANRHHGSGALAYAGTETPSAPVPAPFLPPPLGRTRVDRWHGSAWALWRPDRASGDAIAAAGQLGGSQAGARLDLDLTPAASHRLAAYARLTAALSHPTAPEAATGIAFQPSRRLPVSLALERRIALGPGARNAMAATVVGGFGPSPVAPGLLAEGYGQAGIVGFRRADRFIDGKVNLLAPIGDGTFRLGGSLSGGAQPDVHRVDLGPEMQVRLPLPANPARLSLEWRERLIGNARPASGLALTLAADF